jgi:hypothetical protein
MYQQSTTARLLKLSSSPRRNHCTNLGHSFEKCHSLLELLFGLNEQVAGGQVGDKVFASARSCGQLTPVDWLLTST